MTPPVGTQLVMALLACAPEPAEERGPAPLDDVALLSRISLDLRGVRPTEAEIREVEAQPARLDALVDAYLRDPGFGERLVALYADVYLTRAESFVVDANGDAALLDETDRLAFVRAVGEEPLRLVQRVAEDDLPYTTLVTADWTVANDDLLAAFPLEPLEEGEGWRRARYTDGRPAAGILATNGLWWRYTTTIVNANRGRAETIARHLLCDDRFDQPVAFGGGARLETDFAERVRTEEACIACHATLDPLGAFLYGFFRMHPESYSEALWYYPGREERWQDFSGVAPAFYGQPADTLYELGQLVAADSRFPTCAVEQGFGFLMGRSPGLADTDALTTAREAFLGGGLTLRALYRALVATPGYRSVDERFDGTVPLKRMSPDQLASAVEALTGYRWTWQALDMLTTDTFGVRVLAGGADGMVVTRPSTTHSTSSALVTARLAEAAASHAVSRETALDVADRTLFREVDLAAEPDRAALVAQLRALVLRVHGRRVAEDDPDLLALVELWDAVYADGADPARAWTAVLTGLLRHPDFLQY